MNKSITQDDQNDNQVSKSIRSGTRTETWKGELYLLKTSPGQYEAEFHGRGTYFHIITGRHKYGNYLCIPNHDVGCELSDLADLFWNTERISGLMWKVDAVTIATGLVSLQLLIENVPRD